MASLFYHLPVQNKVPAFRTRFCSLSFLRVYRSASAEFIIDLAIVLVPDPADLAARKGRFDRTIRLINMDTAVESAVLLPFLEFRIIIVQAVRLNVLYPKGGKAGSIDDPRVSEVILCARCQELDVAGGVFAAPDLARELAGLHIGMWAERVDQCGFSRPAGACQNSSLPPQDLFDGSQALGDKTADEKNGAAAGLISLPQFPDLLFGMVIRNLSSIL